MTYQCSRKGNGKLALAAADNMSAVSSVQILDLSQSPFGLQGRLRAYLNTSYSCSGVSCRFLFAFPFGFRLLPRTLLIINPCHQVQRRIKKQFKPVILSLLSVKGNPRHNVHLSSSSLLRTDMKSPPGTSNTLVQVGAVSGTV